VTRVEDPQRLLRLPEPIEPYPAEPADDELAATAALPVAQIVRFDMNTLGGGPLPGVVRALTAYDPASVVEYGDLAYRRLRGALAEVTGVPPHRIIPGAGGDELIRLVSSMTVGGGDTVIIPTPTFGMFAVEARLAGARVVEVPRRHPGRRQTADELRTRAEEETARLVWLCSPNNPTGDAYGAEEIRALADGLAALVVVDAVYQEFAEASARLGPGALSLAQLQDEMPNVVILRSLAKAYGLAGARVGYLTVADGLAARFEAARLPLPVAGPSEAAALGALSDPEAARRRHAEVVAERERLSAELAGAGWEVLPSVANFVLARPAADATRLVGELLARGLVVRSYREGLLRDWLRITARSGEENDRLLAAIAEIGARRPAPAG
jgi:histidinol-phosphate aminotransferase